MTVRESARLQSFPDDWILKGSKTAQGRQIGNAVPVKLAEGIAHHVVGMLRDIESTDAADAEAVG